MVCRNGGRFLAERLRQYRFTDIRETAEEVSIGFVELHDTARAEFDDPSTVWIGDYFAFTIRQDVRRIPASILAETLREALNAWLTEHPHMTKVPKQFREDIKEAVRQKLLAKTLPLPTMFDVAWDTHTGIVTLVSTSKKAIELLDYMFRKAFPEFRLQMIPPYDRAAHLAKMLGLEQQIKAINQATTKSTLDIISANRWIGQDFLLWLMHAGMNGGIDGQRIWIDNKIVLHQTSDNSPQTVAITGPQRRLQEVKAAIRDGKKITEATIYIEDGDDTWRMTLKGDTFYFASYKCPKVTLERDDITDLASEQVAVFLERMHLLNKGIGMLELALATFLEKRLAEDWSDVLQEIDEWLEEQGENTAAQHT